MPAPRDTQSTGVALDERRRPMYPGVDRTREPLRYQRQPVQEFFQAQTKPTLSPDPARGQELLTPDNVKAMNMAIAASNGTLAQSLAAQQIAQQQQLYALAAARRDAKKERAGQSPLGKAVGDQSGNVGLGQFSGSMPDFKWDKGLTTWKGTTLSSTAMAALQRASQIYGKPITGGGFRSHAEQVQLYAQKPDLAAKPGTSWHELGLAIDIEGAITAGLIKAMKKAGFVQFDAGKEPWHFSYLEPH